MLIKISEDVVIPVEIIEEDGDNTTEVTIADVLGVTGSTISWLADLIAFRQLVRPGTPSPPTGPPLPPLTDIQSQEQTADTPQIDLSGNNGLIIYLLLAILNSLNQNNQR